MPSPRYKNKVNLVKTHGFSRYQTKTNANMIEPVLLKLTRQVRKILKIYVIPEIMDTIWQFIKIDLNLSENVMNKYKCSP